MKSEEAEKAWHALIEHNPDCFDYYKEYLYHRGAAIGASQNAVHTPLPNHTGRFH